jgi:probable blue pigment (indigoidine) exporter
VAVALGGLVPAFGQSLHLGGRLDPLALNGWAMLLGGALLLAVSPLSEDWGATAWSADSVFSILYLAGLGTAFTFVTLTVLIRELPAVTTSFISLLIPFGALALGALVRGEHVTGLAVAGAALVAGGIAVAQLPVRPRVRA